MPNPFGSGDKGWELPAAGMVFNAAYAGPIERAKAHVQNANNRNLFLSPHEAIALFHGGFIGFDHFKELMDCSGAFVSQPNIAHKWNYVWQGDVLVAKAQVQGNYSQWDALTFASAWSPSIAELMDMFFRGLIDQPTWQDWLNMRGVSHPAWPKLIYESSKFVPPPGDLIRFAVREVFNDTLRLAYQLDAEFDQNAELQVWGRSIGMRPTYVIDDNGVKHSRDFLADYWAAHWQYPSVGQGYEMVHRLRPDRIEFWRKQVPGVEAFALPDLENLIKVSDYAPLWRKRLAAISYRVPTRVDVRRMLQEGIIDSAEANAQYQDMGFAASHATNMVTLAVNTIPDRVPVGMLVRWYVKGLIDLTSLTERLVRKGFKTGDVQLLIQDKKPTATVATILRWYRRRYITSFESRDRLQKLGYDNGEIDVMLREASEDEARSMTKVTVALIRDAVLTGAMSEAQAEVLLGQTGATPDQTASIFQRINTEIAVGIVKATIGTIRAMFLSGRIDMATAVAKLQQAGVEQKAIPAYQAQWNLAFVRKYRELSAQKTVDLLVRGIINEPEANQRLLNLGYQAVDAAVLLASGIQDRQKAAAAAAAKAARTVQEQQRAAESLIRRQRQEHDRALQDLARHGTPAQIAKWLKKGIINEVTARARLAALEWPAVDADHLIKDALSGK